MSNALDALTFPLWGSRLIEASAGTGKTWTIAALYLRLVLGHGGEDQRHAKPLMPSEILVMTFTRAATRELSDRIRARLLEAAKVFRGEAEPAPHDVMLRGLLNSHAEGAARSQAAWRLASAAESMDDAAVFTIDAWCQRMLREHAFDSGCLFDEELIGNEQAMLDEATRDYWRQQLYPLVGAGLDVALSVWPTVAKLGLDARMLLPHLGSDGSDAQQALVDLIDAVSTKRNAALAALKQGWAAQAAAMQAWFVNLYALPAKDCPVIKTKVNEKNFKSWIAKLLLWAESPHLERPGLSEAALRRLLPEGMAEAIKPGFGVALPPHFEAFAELQRGLDALPPVAEPLRLHAAHRIAARLQMLKTQSGAFGFADMLERLDRALDEARNGANAERLRSRMLAQYPVALIDEFQDTSPLQTRIFDRLYRIAENARERTLLLIGDPKQSIYGFRGADIYSYLQVRRATEGRHYVLGTNYRSTHALVDAVNAVFGHAEQRAGEGAFMFRKTDENPLPFEPVQAQGRSERLVTSDGDDPALGWALAPELSDTASSLRRMAEAGAERIVSLLNDEAAGFLQGADGPFTRLRPADIAVLVRTGREAAAVRRELHRRGVSSVYLSDKDSVFASAEARDLLYLLRSVAAPLDVRLARAALATRTLGLSLAELEQLAVDDEAFERRSEQLRTLHGIWQAQGVLTMLRRALHLLDLPARWLGSGHAEADGERRLTNVLHLAELLQQASTQLDGEQALIRWMTAQRENPGAGGDEQIVRLESDADLVKVVTVHKSKGLEYPLVFLPFSTGFRGIDKGPRTTMVSAANESGGRSLHLTLDAELIAAADKERQREDLRLLYVALTRARHFVWIGVAALKPRSDSADCTSWRSALGYVLSGPEKVSAEQLMADARALSASKAGMAVTIVPRHAALSPQRPRGHEPALREARPYHARFERRWSVNSFSALVRELDGPVTTAVARDDEVMDVQLLAAPRSARRAAPPSDEPWHRFPRGAQPGNFLHDQFEWLAGEGFELAGSPALQEQLLARCERQGHADRKDDVLAWLLAATQTPLQPLGISLAEAASPLAEMEFWLPSTGLQAGAIDALCRRHLLLGRERRSLPERELRGMLMGFADLVFEHEGRYYVLDYKSNALGDDDEAYDAEALSAAMAEHRYDVQAAVYLLALHRLLRVRLGRDRYDPRQHLGGAVYFFLRGIRGPEAGCHHIAAPLELLEQLDSMIDDDSAEALAC